MQQSATVDETARRVVGIRLPVRVQLLDSHTVVSLQRPCEVKRRERQRHRVLVIVQVNLRHTRDSLVENHRSVDLRARRDFGAVHEHPHQLGIHLHGLVRQQRAEVGRVEDDDVIERLHDDAPVLELRHLTIDERLIRHIVVVVEARDILHPVVGNLYAGDAIARRHPNIVHVVLDDRVDDVVQQSRLTRHEYRLLLRRRVEIQSHRGAHPRPSAAVDEHHVSPLAVELADALQILQQSVVLRRLGVVPSESSKRCVHRPSIEQSALLRAYPHAALSVELHGIDVRLQLSAAAKRQYLLVYDAPRRHVVGEIAPLRGDIQHIALRGHIIQVELRLHDRRPRAPCHVVVQENSPLVAVSNLEEAAVIRVDDRAVHILRNRFTLIGSVTVFLLARRQVVAHHRAILVAEEQVLLVPHLHILQVQFHADGEALLQSCRLNEVLATQPHVARLVDKHVVDLGVHAKRGKQTVHVGNERLGAQVDT